MKVALVPTFLGDIGSINVALHQTSATQQHAVLVTTYKYRRSEKIAHVSVPPNVVRACSPGKIRF